MVRSIANAVEQYLAELPDDRRAEVEIDLVAETIRSTSLDEFIEFYEASIASR